VGTERYFVFVVFIMPMRRGASHGHRAWLFDYQEKGEKIYIFRFWLAPANFVCANASES
jgi:hypothetical protein